MTRLALPAVLLALAAGSAAAQDGALSARERQQGAQAHPQLLQEFGGAYRGPQVPYVVGVGQRIASQSGVAARPSDYTVTLLDSPVLNAFAIPGGYVYVTRGLMALMNSEAELASVLGHEVGHVAARHAQKRQSRSLFGTLGALVVGVVTGSGDLANLVGQAGQLYTLRFSRNQEYEADGLGIRYLARAGYDPYSAATMLDSLDRATTLEGRLMGQAELDRTPTWLRTHPLTADRVSRAVRTAEQTGIARGARPNNREPFLNAIDGVLYGDNPEQGFVDGRAFRHPTLRLAFDAPPGFALTNGRDAVSGRGPNGTQLQFSGGALREGEGLDSYVGRIWASLLNNRTPQTQVGRTTVNGIETAVSAARVPTQGGSADVTIAAYRWGPGQAFHLVMVAPSSVGAASAFDGTIRSVRRLSPNEAASLRTRQVDVVTVRPGDTVATFAGQMAFSDARTERFLTLNRLNNNAQLRPGDRVKVVNYRTR